MKKITRVLSDTRVPGYLTGTRVTGIETGTRVPVPSTTRITWLNTVQCGLRAYNLVLNEAVDLAQNRPLCRLMSTYGATHCRWCMPEMKKKNLGVCILRWFIRPETFSGPCNGSTT